ncbi:MAG: DUF4466 domain-containing protein [Pedobacter sp.]|nr:MAG: DUF4466 domain-containing protein [Pedobacter sp.]
MKLIYTLRISVLISLLLYLAACQKKQYEIPTLSQDLQNDCIKRSLGPNVAGQSIEFAYAIAMGRTKGKIISAQVEATIAGAPSTYLENRSFYTNNIGQDVGVTIGTPSINTGNVTKVTFTADTNAATLRFFYVVPQAAKGQSVSFTFSAQSSDGQTVSYKMGPYSIPKMDMVLDLPVSDGNACYISIADMAVYNASNAALKPNNIDVVYLHRSLPTVTFGHALVAPAADPTYLPGFTLPPGVNRNTKISKVYGLRDQQLARDRYGVFIDDIDFQQLDISGAPNYAINLVPQAGVWIETADKKYRAYIFINTENDVTKSAVISIKRYPL